MTPIEIHEYKLRWRPGYTVRLHSDLESQGKDWCKVQLHKQQWNFTKWTAVYEHTFHFEYKQDADSFLKKFQQYANL